jgi:CRP/FNR family cyclic AMP-dependent transcriptional regulator
LRKLTGVHSWIGLLADPISDIVLARMRPRRFADQSPIWQVGDPSTELYLISKGRVRIGTESFAGTELMVAIFRPGDCFGEVGLIDGLPRFNSTYAMGDTELLVLKKTDFTELYTTHAEIARALNLNLCYRLRVAYGLSQDASMLTLRQRLARMLTRLAVTGGQSDEKGGTVVSDVSHEDLAHMLGATRQAVSRALKELECADEIALSYRRILVRDFDRFADRYDSLVGGEWVVPDYDRKKG